MGSSTYFYQKKVFFLISDSFKMFKKFDEKESISGVTQLKSSVQKDIRKKLLAALPGIESFMDDFLPKKDAFKVVKCHDHLELLINSSGRLLFFRSRDGPWCPTLKMLQQYPFLLPRQKVDKRCDQIRIIWCQYYVSGFDSSQCSNDTMSTKYNCWNICRRKRTSFGHWKNRHEYRRYSQQK